MLTLQRQYNSFELGINSGNALTSLEGLYVSLSKAFGKFFIMILVILLLWPLVLFFGVWLKTQRRKLLKSMNNGHVEFKTAEAYLVFRKKVESLDKLKPGLEKVNSYSLEKAPLFVSYTLRQMQKTGETLLTYNSWLHSELEQYNSKQYHTPSKLFRFKSETELWNNRNKAYSYWM